MSVSFGFILRSQHFDFQIALTFLFYTEFLLSLLQVAWVNKGFYQSPLILTELFQHNLIKVSYLTACYLYQVMMTLHFLNDVAYDAESTQK